MTSTLEQRPLLIPVPDGAFGPTTQLRITRSIGVYTALWLIVLVVAGAATGDGWRAAALGLIWPGGGFVASGSFVMAAVVLAIFVLGLVVWWFFGATIVPPLVLAGTAWWGAASADDLDHVGLTLAVGPTLIVLGLLVHLARHRAQVRVGAALNRELATAGLVVGGAPDLAAGLPVAESSAEDLARLRFGLDLALQPVDEFTGFTHLDQYREAALRYQLNALSYGLSMAQFTRTPAFGGYLAEAQRNAIEKMLVRRAWAYWAHENAWGNLKWDPEPVENSENIMLTGFYGLQIGMYETLNDDRYSQPGALAFRWNAKRTYDHSFGSLASSIHRNMNASDYTLFPCEPNWIYTVCNTFGINTLVSHDRLHGTAYATEVQPKLQAAYDREFVRPDGKLLGVRAAHLGMTWNFWASPSVQTTTTYWMHAALPELSLRTWWLLKRGLEIRDGILHLPTFATKNLDPGNYLMLRDTFGHVVTMMAARELGDEEYAAAAQRTLDEREPIEDRGGVRRMERSSGLANLYASLGRFGRENGLRDLVSHGTPEAWRTGPVLAECAYPDVLVAKAVTDGQALDLVLLPGAGPVRTDLAIERLVPGREYQVTGAATSTATADSEGRAIVTVDLGERLEVRVY
ncbi:hypothetical protein [Aeromicrobium alkaliterrae]|uniref:Linalool dehydratase/isomerase domain-containing protein n=1 Tax=Aeromicrobium alkaliterrae TaxID=302168 RepID=A0ABN2JGG8_9ACTN